MASGTIHRFFLGILTTASLVATGCSTSAPSSAAPPGAQPIATTSRDPRDTLQSRLARREMIDDMMNEALQAPELAQKAALVLAASDRATEEVGKTSRAIDTAIDIVIENARNADTIGYKAVTAHVSDGSAPIISLDQTQGRLENSPRRLISRSRAMDSFQ